MLTGFFGGTMFMASSSLLQTYKDLQIKRSARYAVHEVIGEAPVVEYIGPGQAEISFNVQLHENYTTLAAFTTLLQMQLDSGEAYPLFLATNYFGEFVLTDFQENPTRFTGIGKPQYETVALTLRQAKGFSLVSAASSALGF